MARKPHSTKAVASITTILVAVGELRGGGEVLESGAELTKDKQEALGLDQDAVAELVARGVLHEVSARQAEAVGSEELAAAKAQAEHAEARVAELEAKVAELEKQLAAAKQAA